MSLTADTPKLSARRAGGPRSAVGAVTIVGLAAVVFVGCGSDTTGSVATTTTLPVIATATAPTTVPAPTTTLAAYYEVQSGDTLSAIAARFDVRLEDLIGMNELADPDHVEVGMMLQIPPPTVLLNSVSTSSTAAPTTAATAVTAVTAAPTTAG